jgi:peptidyl-prolyl cis-trans isomerase C
MIRKVLFLFALSALLSGCGGSSPDHPLVFDGDVVLVDVDGQPITLSMLEHLMEVRNVTEDDEEGMRRLLDELIRLQAIANRAQLEGVSDDPDIRAQRMIRDIETQYVRYLQQFQLDNPVTDDEIRSVYRSQVQRTADRRFKLETIEFATQAPALAELQALESGERTFAEAIDRATEDGRLARRTDWIDSTQVPADFAPALTSSEPGDVVESLLPYEGQWQVVRVVETERFEPPPLSEVREGIRRTLTREKVEAMVERTYEDAEITPMLPLDDAAPEDTDGGTDDAGAT